MQKKRMMALRAQTPHPRQASPPGGPCRQGPAELENQAWLWYASVRRQVRRATQGRGPGRGGKPTCPSRQGRAKAEGLPRGVRVAGPPSGLGAGVAETISKGRSKTLDLSPCGKS